MTSHRYMHVSLIVLVAMLINLVMFGMIQYMTGNKRIRLADTSDFQIANFIRVQEASRDVRSRRDPRAPQKPDAETQQELQRMARSAPGQSGGVSGLAVSVPQFEVDISSSIGSNIQVARELTPLVRVPPEYPPRALDRDIEGYVMLRFTVTEEGNVADPEVLQSDPPGVFERAAISSILGWKYQPQIIDGVPIRVTTYARIRFNIGRPNG